MQTREWTAVADDLDRYGFPGKLELDDSTLARLRENDSSPESSDAGSHPSPSPAETAPGDIFALCPRCLAKTRSLAADSRLVEFLRFAADGGFMDLLEARGALETLRKITDALKSADAGPDAGALKSLLACIAPFHVDATFVKISRRDLGIEPADNRHRGGVLEISNDFEEGADAIIRGALFDQPCSWKEESFARDAWPKGRCTLNAFDVPAPGTVEKDRVDVFRKRLLDACRASSLSTAMQSMAEWLYDGQPLTVLCDSEISRILSSLGSAVHEEPDGTTYSVEDLALFLSKCEESKTKLRGLLERLRSIVNILANP